MNCPKCDTNLSWKKMKCDRCGQDLSIYKRVLSASNSYYNDALIKAKIRDLSGAVLSLKKSLQLNKKNTHARNLLGLVYYEMGEVVAALSEWVLSKHFQSEDNVADEYMDAVQSDPTGLDTINQAIKKYNSSLLSAKQGNEDLAIIQLKKVVSLNPKFIRAYHLLALLIMQTGENDKAVKVLNKAAKIDINNTTTLNYLRELHEKGAKREIAATDNKFSKREEVPSFSPISSYKEDKPNLLAFLNIILGIMIGIAVAYFLIVPTMEKKVVADLGDDKKSYSEQLAEKNSEISSLKNTNKKIEERVDTLKEKLEEVDAVEYDETLFDDLFKATKLFMEEDNTGAAEMLLNVKDEALLNTEAKALYDVMKGATFLSVSGIMFEEGRTIYNSGKFEEAIPILLKAVDMNPDNVDAIYFLGRAYHRLDDKENAKKYYNMVINEYPDSYRVREAKTKISQLN